MIMNEEEIIKKKFGCENPFKVPEGYFEQLTSNIMSQLPESQKVKPRNIRKSSVRQWRIRLIGYAAAACVCGAMLFGVSSLMHRHHLNAPATTSQPTATQYAVNEEEYINDALDYAMVSNQEIALYLTDVY